MIPKILHFVWIGSDLTNFCKISINHWSKMNPDYQIMIHGEEIIPDDLKKSLYFDGINNIQKSDIARVCAVQKYGGWYFDIDIIPTKHMWHISSLCKKGEHHAFIIGSMDKDGRIDDCNSCIYADSPDSDLSKELLAFMKQRNLKGHFHNYMYSTECFQSVARSTKYPIFCADHWQFYGGSFGPSMKKELWNKFESSIINKSISLDLIVRSFPNCLAVHLWHNGSDSHDLKDIELLSRVEFDYRKLRKAWDENISDDIIINDSYKIKNIGPVRLAIDIGAHIGSFPIAVRVANPEARIVCLEPHPVNFSMLHSNTSRFENVELFQKALYGSDGKRIFISDFPMLGPNLNTGMSTVCGCGPFECETIYLDTLLSQYPECDLLKIDAEGAEVCFGESKRVTSVKWIVGEYHSRSNIKMIFDKLGDTHFISIKKSSDDLGSFFARREE